MKRKGQIIIGLALILIFILMALAAPVLAPNDPNATNLALKNAPPSAEYPLGSFMLAPPCVMPWSQQPGGRS